MLGGAGGGLTGGGEGGGEGTNEADGTHSLYILVNKSLGSSQPDLGQVYICTT
jgi:hypothetical protein